MLSILQPLTIHWYMHFNMSAPCMWQAHNSQHLHKLSLCHTHTHTQITAFTQTILMSYTHPKQSIYTICTASYPHYTASYAQYTASSPHNTESYPLFTASYPYYTASNPLYIASCPHQQYTQSPHLFMWMKNILWSSCYSVHYSSIPWNSEHSNTKLIVNFLIKFSTFTVFPYRIHPPLHSLLTQYPHWPPWRLSPRTRGRCGPPPWRWQSPRASHAAASATSPGTDQQRVTVTYPPVLHNSPKVT